MRLGRSAMIVSCMIVTLRAMAIVVWATVAGPGPVQDSLTAAKELYASAAYEEALTALERMRPDTPPDLAGQVDQYRAFCLFALGRTTEAQAVAQDVLRADPLLQLDSIDASPRLVALFVDLQKRLLPGLVRERYRAARASMEQAQLAAADRQLAVVQQMLVKARALDIWDEALADMSVLVDGFLELNRATGERRVAAPSVTVTAAAGAPGGTPVSGPASSTPIAPQIYTALDARVAAPIVIRQDIPPLPAGLARWMRAASRGGVVEVTIDESGTVERAVMREPVTREFDELVLAAAREWRYQPAKLSGVPVRYQKQVTVRLTN